MVWVLAREKDEILFLPFFTVAINIASSIVNEITSIHTSVPLLRRCDFVKKCSLNYFDRFGL